MKRLLTAVALIAMAGTPTITLAQSALRLVDAIDASERPDHTDISIIFGCSLRYLSHTPASRGNTLRLRFAPLPDCGQLSGSPGPAPPLEGVSMVRALEIDQITLSEVDITLRFASEEVFVLAPTSDSRGVRIRLLRPRTSGARITVYENAGPPAGYAINLAVSRTPFDDEAIQAATRVTGSPAYVSEYILGGEPWYRLRIGPFDTESGARKILSSVRHEYPKAWLAIGDDEKLNAEDGSGVASILPVQPRANRTLTAQDAEAIFRKAKTAFSRKDYATAIPLLTRLLEQPEFSRRAEAQELMGLTRERNRQIAHAKGEYEEYLRRYPDGPAVRRVQERLRALRLAARRSITGLALGEADRTWKVYGGAAQTYRRDSTQLDNDVRSIDLTTQNALLTDLDFVARRRGERFNFSSRASFGYIRDLMSEGPGDQTRVNLAFVELADRDREWSARLGRQSRNTGGLFGTFDGVSAARQVMPRLRVEAAYGYPVETARQSIDTTRQFTGLLLGFGTFADAWDVSLYGLRQQVSGSVDRQAIGTEVRYFRPGRTVIALADYDVQFNELSNALVLATFALPSRWTLTANVDQRKSPGLSLRNALIGQPVATFEELLELFPRSELERLALERTADSRLYSLSLSRPVGERWQWTIDYSSITTTGTPASAGVDEVLDAGPEKAISLQGIAASLFGGNDLTAIALRRQTSALSDTDSLGISTRFPISRSWRLGPRLRVDRREIRSDGSRQMLYTPALRIDLQRTRMLFECELGAELGSRRSEQRDEDTTRYYLSLGYRLNI